MDIESEIKNNRLHLKIKNLQDDIKEVVINDVLVFEFLDFIEFSEKNSIEFDLDSETKQLIEFSKKHYVSIPDAIRSLLRDYIKENG